MGLVPVYAQVDGERYRNVMDSFGYNGLVENGESIVYEMLTKCYNEKDYELAAFALATFIVRYDGSEQIREDQFWVMYKDILKHDFNTVEQVYTYLIDCYGESGQLCFYLAAAYYDTERYEKAVKMYEKSINLWADSIISGQIPPLNVHSSYMDLSQCYYYCGDYKKAIYVLNKAKSSYGASHNMWEDFDIVAAQIQYVSESPRKQIRKFSNWIKEYSDSWGAVSYWVNLRMKLCFKIKDYKKALAAIPDEEEYNEYDYLFRAMCYHKLGKTGKAERDYRAAQRMAPDDLYVQAAVEIGIGDSAKAVNAIYRLVNSHIGDKDLIYQASYLFARMGDYDHALFYLEQALRSGFCDFATIDGNFDFDPIRNTERFKSLVAKYKPVLPEVKLPKSKKR